MFNLKALPPIERKPDGSLPRMTPKQRQAAVKLIRKICCNYDNGNCVLLDEGDGCVCVQSISYSVNCKFFADEDIRKEFEEWRKKRQEENKK